MSRFDLFRKSVRRFYYHDVPVLWDNFKKKTFDKPSMVFGVKIEESDPELLGNFLFDAMEYITLHPREGIFRLSGSKDEIESIKKKIDSGTPVTVFKMNNINNVAGLLKNYFRSLPEPLLEYSNYQRFINIQSGTQQSSRIYHIKDVLKNRVPVYKILLIKKMMKMLREISKNQKKTKMDSRNLSIIFAPSFSKKSKPTPQGGGPPPTSGQVDVARINTMMSKADESQKLVMMFIDNYEKIFNNLFDEIGDPKTFFIRLLKKKKFQVTPKPPRIPKRGGVRRRFEQISQMKANKDPKGSDEKQKLERKNVEIRKMEESLNKKEEALKRREFLLSSNKNKEYEEKLESLRRKEEELKQREKDVNERESSLLNKPPPKKRVPGPPLPNKKKYYQKNFVAFKRK